MTGADVRLLGYFVAVAERLHFGRAAAALYVSQPALSQQVRRLERDLGVQLFVRDRHGVALTGAGAALLEPSRRAVAAATEVAAAARGLAREQRREIVVGFMNSFPDGFLPRVLRTYRVARPAVSVDVRQYDFRDTSVGLRSGEADVSLVHLPFSWEGARWEPLFTTERVAMLAEDHPLATRGSVTVAELAAAGTPWATPPPEADADWRQFWSALPQRRALGAADGQEVVSLTPESYFSQVATGAALGLSDAMIEPAYRPAGVVFVPVSDLSPSERVVAWRTGDDREDVVAMVAAVRQVAAAASTPSPHR